MGNNSALLVADLFLFCYESLSDDKQVDIIWMVFQLQIIHVIYSENMAS